jgi:branched-chain amino acid transport system permease protein
VIGGLLVGLAENLSLLVHQRRLQDRDAVPRAAARAAGAAARRFSARRRRVGHADRNLLLSVFFACIVLILGILTLGLNLQWGFTGLFNAGIVGFYAIGAYTHAILTAPPQPQYLGNLGLPWVVGIAAAMAATALAAWLIGLLTIRLRGDYLAIATFGIAVSIQLAALNWEALTGGSQGLSRIPKPLAGVFDTPLSFNLWFLCLLAALVAAVYAALERILRSPWGTRAQGDPRRRNRCSGARQERAALSPRSVRARLDADGSCRCALRELHRLRQPLRFSADPHVPGLGHADCRRQRQQPRRADRCAAGMDDLVGSGIAVTKLVPPSHAAQGAAIQVILIGLLLILVLLYRPRGLIGEAAVVSRHADD